MFDNESIRRNLELLSRISPARPLPLDFARVAQIVGEVVAWVDPRFDRLDAAMSAEVFTSLSQVEEVVGSRNIFPDAYARFAVHNNRAFFALHDRLPAQKLALRASEQLAEQHANASPLQKISVLLKVVKSRVTYVASLCDAQAFKKSSKHSALALRDFHQLVSLIKRAVEASNARATPNEQRMLEFFQNSDRIVAFAFKHVDCASGAFNPFVKVAVQQLVFPLGESQSFELDPSVINNTLSLKALYDPVSCSVAEARQVHGLGEILSDDFFVQLNLLLCGVLFLVSLSVRRAHHNAPPPGARVSAAFGLAELDNKKSELRNFGSP